MSNTRVKMIDLFAGCGGLTDGFMQTGLYEEIAAVEWLKPQVLTLRKRLKEKWGEFLMHSGRHDTAKYIIEMYKNNSFKQVY